MKCRTTVGSFAVAALASVAVILAMSASRRATGANAPGAAPAATPSTPAAAPGKLVVHEWGTFTGFAASDGTHLPFSSAIGSDLPLFVYNRPAQAARLKASGPREPGTAELPGISVLFAKDGIVSTQRMETPVIYFYTDAPRDVDVRVDFPKGLITEFYPPVREMGPAYPQPNGEKLADSFLSWGKVHLIPDTGAAAAGSGTGSESSADRPGAHIPRVEEKAHYAHARETDSAIVRFDDGRSRDPHEEKFLFYRGLGNFTLPVTLGSDGDDHFTLLAGPDPIRSAFLIRVEGDRVRFSRYTDLRGNCSLELPTETRPIADLSDVVAKALVAEGLYEREARAMVRTWEDSWFREAGTGTRLLYTIPRPATDALLPLAITPTPDELVRVMVGRVDVMTREQEAKIATLLTRPSDRGGMTAQEARDLKALGRFLSPAVDRVADQQARKLVQAAYAVPEK